MRAIFTGALVAVTVVCTAPTPSQVIPIGDEVQVNQYTQHDQNVARLATNALGDTLIVWESGSISGDSGQDGSGSAIVARLVDSDGQFAGDEVVLNEFTVGGQSTPWVAALPGGEFVVVWSSHGQDGNVRGVFGRRVDLHLAPLASEFQINSYTTGQQEDPVVASAGDGRFLVVWEAHGGQDGSGFGVFGQLFAADGEPLGGEFQVNTATQLRQYRPGIAGTPGGGFIVVWDGASIRGQRFDAQGEPSGPELDLSMGVAGGTPRVAMNGSGAFVVVWHDFVGTTYEIYGRGFDASGVALGDAVRLNHGTQGTQSRADVAFLTDDDVVVVWQSRPTSVEDDVLGRLFDVGLAPSGGEFQVNALTSGYQERPAVAATAGDDFLVAWNSRPDLRGARDDVFVRRLQPAIVLGAQEIPVLSPWGLVAMTVALAGLATVFLLRRR